MDKALYWGQWKRRLQRLEARTKHCIANGGNNVQSIVLPTVEASTKVWHGGAVEAPT